VFTQTTGIYDRIYSFKDYGREAAVLVRIIRKHHPSAGSLLDVACGTGRHLEHLAREFSCDGADIMPQFCRIARLRNPKCRIYRADMRDLGIPRRYDAVVCLFSSIGYARTTAGLAKALSSMARVLRPGGILVVEPWFTPSSWKPGTVHAVHVEEPHLVISRLSTSRIRGRVSVIEMQYLVGSPRGTRHFTEIHRLGLFTIAEMKAAFAKAGLEVTWDKAGLTGRGLYIGRKAKEGRDEDHRTCGQRGKPRAAGAARGARPVAAVGGRTRTDPFRRGRLAALPR
jgi:ubiquinone/menaquinone biosynthesis C-methylase UbiE